DQIPPEVPRGKRHRIARAPLPLTYRGSKWPSQAGSSPGLRLQYGFARDRDNAHIGLLRSHPLFDRAEYPVVALHGNRNSFLFSMELASLPAHPTDSCIRPNLT